MTQKTLFDAFDQQQRTAAPPRARRTDPQTSHDAAEKHEASGKLRESSQRVLDALRQHPGSTYAELAEYAGLDRPEPARRLPELQKLGLVYVEEIDGQDERRRCMVTGSVCRVWRPEP